MTGEDVRLAPEDGLYGCFTIDDVAAGDGRRIEPLLEWLDQQHVTATFFVIPYSEPNQAPLFEDPDLVELLNRARAAGHEVHPHGYDHALFECGLPDLMAVHDEAMMRRIARTLSREEFALRHSHTRGMLGARLERAVRIWEATFGERPVGFRSGYHAFCRDLYGALEVLQIRWTSTRTATPSAWRPVVLPEAEEVVPWVGLLPYWVGRVLEIPHLCDYGSHIPPSDVPAWVGLARRHLIACRTEAAPFIPVAHLPGLRCAGDPTEWVDTGYRSYEQVLDLARSEFGVQFVGMSTVAAQALETPDAWQARDQYRR